MARQPPHNSSTASFLPPTLPRSTEKTVFSPRAQTWPTILTSILKTWQPLPHTEMRSSKGHSTSSIVPPSVSTPKSRNSSRILNPPFHRLEDRAIALAAAETAPATKPPPPPPPPLKNTPSNAASRNYKRLSSASRYKAVSAPPTAMLLATNTTASRAATKPWATSTRQIEKTRPA